MRASLTKTVVGSLAALAIGVSTVAAVAPASAATVYPHGGLHGGVHGGAHGGYWRGGHWYGGGWGPAAIGLGVLGLAAGAAIATQAPYGPDGCVAYRPVYDAYGNYMGRRPVNVC